MKIQHAHHDLAVSTMHAHLDHDHSIGTVLVKGQVQAVRRFANMLAAERAVRQGQINVVMVDLGCAYRRGDGEPHTHLKPQR
jgi:CopG family nickel-responsive transcriptional regulator